MKYPVARKLPSGSWTCRVRVHGQDISITRQDKKVAIAEAMAIKAGIKAAAAAEPLLRRSRTVSQAIDDYIADRENVLSPATIRGYRVIQAHRFLTCRNFRIADVSASQWQQIVNKEAKVCSAKTLKNAWGLLSATIYDSTGSRITVRLPQVVQKESTFLTPEQIPVFLAEIKGKSFEIPALLALSSLRKSEILALRWENIDMKSKTIQVDGAAVPNAENRLQFKKTTKNNTSRRKIPIIPPLEQAIDEAGGNRQGLIVKTSPGTLYGQINRACRNCGLPEVGIHGLRRTFASLAYHLGLSEEITMRIGGWSNIYTMRKIYTKLSERDVVDQSAVLSSFFAENANNGNEIVNKGF